MKKRKTNNKMDCISMQNPVAKFAGQFNKSQIYRDKSKYTRKPKHGKQEVFPVVFSIELPEKPFAIKMTMPGLTLI
jgi:hypothetical protein